MITRVLVVLNAMILFLLLSPGTASARCGPSMQIDAGDPMENCGPAQAVVGSVVVALLVGLTAAVHAANSLARGAAAGQPDPALPADAVAVAGATPPGLPAPEAAPPLQLPLSQAIQLAEQGAQAAGTTAVEQAQQAAQAATRNNTDAAQRAADAAAALIRSAWEGAEAAANAAMTTARAAQDRTKDRSYSIRQAARAAVDAAKNAALMAGNAGTLAHLAADASARITGAQSPADAVAAAHELTVAAADAAYAAHTAAENATITDLAAQQAGARAQVDENRLAQGQQAAPKPKGIGLSNTQKHDGAVRAVIPTLKTFFDHSYVYGDVAGYKYLSYINPHGLDPSTEWLAGASADNPGKNKGRPDIVVDPGDSITFVYEVKAPSKSKGKGRGKGLSQATRDQIAGYVKAFRELFRPQGWRTEFGPPLPPTVVGMDPSTGLIYHLWSLPDYPGVIFYAVV
ncbi:hypothetical protein [Amycolatopsis sp. NPDC098790]|uniref:hypothetical protein n=1 Tax=Amycolatopsis sp. NPDC098790 TaxID=3363939 RepID=UPI003807963A